jgi:hypothetical protein
MGIRLFAPALSLIAVLACVWTARLEAQAAAFAVTLEPAGGLPAPSGEMYLLGKS